MSKNKKLFGIIAAVIIAAVLIGGYIFGFYLLNDHGDKGDTSQTTVSSVQPADDSQGKTSQSGGAPLPSMTAEQITQQEDDAIKDIGDKMNINTATESEFMLLDGIGETLAARIVETREAMGGFKTIEDIKKVKGIGDKLYESMKDYIYVGSE